MKGDRLDQPVRVLIVLEAQQRQELRQLAESDKTCVADLIRLAIERFLDANKPLPAPPLAPGQPLTTKEETFLDLLKKGATADSLMREGWPVGMVLSTLLSLEIKRYVIRANGQAPTSRFNRPGVPLLLGLHHHRRLRESLAPT